MSPTLWFLSLLLLFPLVLTSCSSSSAAHPRRLLHQPLLPTPPILPTPTPAPSPQPQPQHTQPKLPFSSASPSPPSPKNPFFFPSNNPSSPFPPPPPTVLATFPANISSLLLPRPAARNHHPVLALALSLSLLSLALLSAAIAIALHRRTRTSSASAGDEDRDKDSTHSDALRLFPGDAATSDGGDRKTRGRTSSPRSEYLYLGTVLSSEPSNSSCSGSSNSGGVRPPPYRKLSDSPELKPLPPLPRHTFRPWPNDDEDREETKKEEEEEERKQEEEEEFFSPRGSSANKQQSPPSPVFLAGSSSRSPFYLESLGSKSFISKTHSYHRSNSPTNSHSFSPISPASLKSLPPRNTVSASPSPSFASSFSSPKLGEEDLSSTWDVSGKGKDIPAKKLASPPLPPPPPPPPPPPRFWETTGQNVGVGGEVEESPKPKLKALHWDKVKASSDRTMVWDRLRPSSFQ